MNFLVFCPTDEQYFISTLGNVKIYDMRHSLLDTLEEWEQVSQDMSSEYILADIRYDEQWHNCILVQVMFDMTEDLMEGYSSFGCREEKNN